ncbi:MAG: hypothetical protein C7B47_11610 [Sulfobacillus thermosulfidooxidans]|uniref:Uncharacterized protein n=1 Tax=Sulfobacillus thermosulfidooxidans TaxID=28034 RepID=A0A2T2WTY7_SULTH|nr:MAG: hypothetical protein C7B47_11610 [Sulfobacillus thermosulfidooxidans]
MLGIFKFKTISKPKRKKLRISIPHRWTTNCILEILKIVEDKIPKRLLRIAFGIWGLLSIPIGFALRIDDKIHELIQWINWEGNCEG